jgi:hypothetical protein
MRIRKIIRREGATDLLQPGVLLLVRVNYILQQPLLMLGSPLELLHTKASMRTNSEEWKSITSRACEAAVKILVRRFLFSSRSFDSAASWV